MRPRRAARIVWNRYLSAIRLWRASVFLLRCSAGEGSDQALTEDEGRRGRARVDAELAQDVGDVRLRRAQADAQRVSDLLIGAALDQQAQDIQLAGCQAAAWRRRWRWSAGTC